MHIAFAVFAVAFSLSAGPGYTFDPRARVVWFLFALLFTILVAVPVTLGDRVRGDALLVSVIAFLLFTPAISPRPLDPIAFVVAGILLAILRYGRGRPGFAPAELLYRFSPILLAAFVYANLRRLAPADESVDIDAALADLDLQWFGTHLTIALEPLSTWWLSEWFSLHYAFYLAFPVAAAVLTYWRDREAFEDYALCFCLGMYLSFVSYLMFPAKGPLVGLASSYQGPLPGALVTRANAALVEQYHYVHDTFPSMHTANSLMALWALHRVSRRWFWFFVFCEVNLLASTIYLRMHYTIDLVAGAVFAAGVVFASIALNRAARGAVRAAPLR